MIELTHLLTVNLIKFELAFNGKHDQIINKLSDKVMIIMKLMWITTSDEIQLHDYMKKYCKC